MPFNRIGRASVLLVRLSGRATESLVCALEARGMSVAHAPSFEVALAEIATQTYPLVLFDLAPLSALQHHVVTSDLGDRHHRAVLADDPLITGQPTNDLTESGLRFLQAVRSSSPVTQVVVLVSRQLDLATCCQAVTAGAASFVEWSQEDGADRVIDRLNQAYARYEAAVAQGREMHSARIFDETGLAGQSQVMARLLFQAKRAAIISDAPVLITGESGTGKQLLAEAIHRLDPKRKGKPFLTVNCAAITGTLAESALFGHRRGAFTGATEDRPGYFRSADHGTIFLDEISELEKSLQPKLLRVLQEGRVLPVGEDREQKINVRVIAACNRPLPIMVEKNEFRLDLYQRLNVISLEIPPLRERPDDVPLLMQFFLRRYADYYPHRIESVDERVYEVLTHSVGAGNVRELENAVRQILAFKQAGTRIELSDIPPHLLRRNTTQSANAGLSESITSAVEVMMRSQGMTLAEMLDEFERVILHEAIARNHASHAQLAHRLGLSRRTLYNKLRKHHNRVNPRGTLLD